MKQKQSGNYYISIKFITVLLGFSSVFTLYFVYYLFDAKHTNITQEITDVKLHLKSLLNQLEVQANALRYGDIQSLSLQPLVKLTNEASLIEGI